ncbi:response regulator [Deferribacteraceae bacterium V6Fe1]|nr:response regulator [Deferribacteraceae bacterium V6Fe1]
MTYFYIDKQSYENLIKNYNSKIISEFESGYKSIYNVFENTSKTLYSAYITNNEILEMLNKGMYLKEDEDKYRKLLEAKFSNIYEKLKKIGFTQIHFHTSDGYSFLRMHNPNKHGDYLADTRPTIKQIIHEHKYISGYEVGVHEGGFRFIFPLFYNDIYIGSVETSAPIENYLKYLSNELKSQFTVIYHGDALKSIDKSLIDKKFKKISESNDLYFDINLPNNILDKDALEAVKKDLNERYSQERSFIINFEKDKNMHSLIFIPLSGVDGRHIGHIVKHIDSPELGVIKRDFYYKIISSSTIFIFITIFIIFVILKNRKLSKEITLRKNIQERLEDANKKFEIVIKSSGQIIYDYDVDTDEINRFGAIQETLGYNEEEFASGIYENFKQFYHPEDMENVKKFIEKLIATKGKGQITYRLKRKDGNYSTIQDESTFTYFDNKRHIFGVMKDITEKLAMEEHLKRAQQLEAIGILAGGIAHDFNNYLSGIYNYLEVLKLSCQDPKIDAITEKILKSFDRAKSLTNQLLTFSKGGEPVIKIFNVKKLIENIADFALSGSSLKYEITSSDDLLCCLGDENQIGQVIENILINARQAVESSGEIKIQLKNISKHEAISFFNNKNLEKDAYILISISDTGKGISKENLDKIFQPFFTTKSKGHGLGLSIAYNIVKKHNGDIIVNSSPNTGTTFYVALEATYEKCQNIDVKIESKPKNKLNILIMDDEEEILDSLSQLIDILGYNAICAKNGNEAIEIYKRYKDQGEKIDLCILDVTIKGGMGGKETIENLLKIDKDAKAIVSSGYSDDEIMAHPQKYGFCGSLQKPFKIEDITKMLKDI